MPAHKPTSPKTADDPEQYRRFVEMAREVEADETPGAMDRAFDRVMKGEKVTPSAPPVRRSGKRPAS